MDLDNEIAEATDALLDRRKVRPLASENAELFDVVRGLNTLIDPHNLPSEAFQQRLTSRLSAEWDRSYTVPTLRLLDRPALRVLAMAAAVVLVLASLVVLSVPETTPALQGTAIPLDDAAAIFVLLGVVTVGAVVYWRGRR
jgi:hypothetical protein